MRTEPKHTQRERERKREVWYGVVWCEMVGGLRRCTGGRRGGCRGGQAKAQRRTGQPQDSTAYCSDAFDLSVDWVSRFREAHAYQHDTQQSPSHCICCTGSQTFHPPPLPFEKGLYATGAPKYQSKQGHMVRKGDTARQNRGACLCRNRRGHCT